MVGSIQCWDRNEVQPNQNKPIGRQQPIIQLEYNRHSGSGSGLPARKYFLVRCSIRVLRQRAIRVPIAIAVQGVSWVFGIRAAAFQHTGKYRPNLGGSESMIFLEYQRNTLEKPFNTRQRFILPLPPFQRRLTSRELPTQTPPTY